jgi:hypothetical protein
MALNIESYFESTHGTGVMASSDGEGRINIAIYARPQVIEKGKVALILANRLTLKNLRENPRAAYLFIEDGPGYKGLRLYLKKVGEDTDKERVRSLLRDPMHKRANEDLTVVYFEIEKALSLVGPAEIELSW